MVGECYRDAWDTQATSLGILNLKKAKEQKEQQHKLSRL